MENKIIWIIQLLSSTVVAAVIAGGFATAKEKYKNRMTYIIAERKGWRDKLRELEKSITEIEFSFVNSDIEKKEKLSLIKSYIAEFETRLNIFGKILSYNVLYDSHFWSIIDDIYSYESYDELIKSQKLMILRRYVSALLKRDWENSKNDIIGSYGNITLKILDIMIGLYMLLISVFNLTLYIHQEALKYSYLFNILLVLLTFYFACQFVLYKKIRKDGIKNSKFLFFGSWVTLVIYIAYIGIQMAVFIILNEQISSMIGEKQLIFLAISLYPFTVMALSSFLFKQVIFDDIITLDNKYIRVVKSIKRESYKFSRLEKKYRKKEKSSYRRRCNHK